MAGEPVRVVSRRFGTYDVPTEHVIRLPEGLVGLPEARRVALLDPKTPDAPLRYLLCVDEPELAFLVCDPEQFFPGYLQQVPRPAGATPADVAVLAIVTVPDVPRDMTANLLAPIVVDCRTREGRQVILDVTQFSTRHRLLPEP